jgi:hypothetical protein
VTTARAVGQEHADLAASDRAGCPGVLRGHARGLHALLQETGVVYDQYALRATEMLDHIVADLVPHGVDVPIGPPQQTLHPVRGQVSGLLGERPAGLAIEPAAAGVVGTAVYGAVARLVRLTELQRLVATILAGIRTS